MSDSIKPFCADDQWNPQRTVFGSQVHGLHVRYMAWYLDPVTLNCVPLVGVGKASGQYCCSCHSSSRITQDDGRNFDLYYSIDEHGACSHARSGSNIRPVADYFR